ncbi:unnamed protein product [Cuscuta epithymum]|uniref:Uncharacterized protein n=1 Tax=Cuscuta epithymum TaxID=186058 RepID=A0AAV0F9B8_9ASTE|nr:unnamed protein product [Cuscuta epithymum]
MNVLDRNCRGISKVATTQELTDLVPTHGTGDERTGRDEGLSKGEYKSAVRPPPEPPPWIDRDARVWKMMFQETSQERVWSICQLFYFLWSYFRVMFVYGVSFLLMILVLGLQ